MYAFCYRSGEIEFGKSMPDGTLPLGNSRSPKRLREIVTVNARRAYDGVTLLVPGLPEAGTEDEALDARRYFSELVSMRLAGKRGWPAPRLGMPSAPSN